MKPQFRDAWSPLQGNLSIMVIMVYQVKMENEEGKVFRGLFFSIVPAKTQLILIKCIYTKTEFVMFWLLQTVAPLQIALNLILIITSPKCEIWRFRSCSYSFIIRFLFLGTSHLTPAPQRVLLEQKQKKKRQEPLMVQSNVDGRSRARRTKQSEEQAPLVESYLSSNSSTIYHGEQQEHRRKKTNKYWKTSYCSQIKLSHSQKGSGVFFCVGRVSFSSEKEKT